MSFLLGKDLAEYENKKSSLQIEKPVEKIKEIKVELRYEIRRYRHPDICATGPNQSFILEIDGERVPYLCRRGIVDTDNPKLFKYLESHDFTFIRFLDEEDFDDTKLEDLLMGETA